MQQVGRAQVAYCEEQVECRRSVLLAHFNEAFDAARCRGTCDTCAGRAGRKFEQRNVTATAVAAVTAVRAVRGKGTLMHVVDVLRGASNRAVRDRGHDQLAEFGSGRDLRRAHMILVWQSKRITTLVRLIVLR